MASWDNGGRGVDGVNQIGVAKPSTFFNSFFPTAFGSNSSSTSALPNPPAANTKGKFVGFDSFLFGRQTTANSDTLTSRVATQPPPFRSYQCGGGDHELFRKNPGTGAFQNAWPYGWAGFPFSGNLQFGSQFSLGSSAAATISSPFGNESPSPFGNESPSYSSSSSTFGTISSGFRSSTTGPFTRSLVQENSSANNVSVFTPFTRSNLGISDIQGTRICSYAPTPEADNISCSSCCGGKLISISAMPFYQEKSHEELRLEDYQLTGRTGSSIINTNSKSSNQQDTSADNGFVFAPFTNSDQGRSGCQGTKWSYETSPFGNESPSYSSSSSTFGTISSGIRSSTTGPFTRSFGQENSSANNVSVFAPLTRSNLGMSDIQGTRYCSYTTTPVVDNNKYCEMISISAMPFYSNKSHEELRLEDYTITERTGGFTPGFLCSTDNRQQPMSKCHVSDERTPPIEKYKPDDEDVMAMIPKLKCPEYYMEPSMEDLAANELKMPEFCCKVNDFVIGKHGYGSIKFLGETDVRNLDLESIVQFNNREVIVCIDKKNGKPPVGQGLNKAAEITLLNVNCIDKNTGKQYIDGPKVDKYTKLLMRKTADQGAEFVSFDPAKGEWKFKVQHF